MRPNHRIASDTGRLEFMISGTFGVAVKCVDIKRKARGEGGLLG